MMIAKDHGVADRQSLKRTTSLGENNFVVSQNLFGLCETIGVYSHDVEG